MDETYVLVEVGRGGVADITVLADKRRGRRMRATLMSATCVIRGKLTAA